MHSSVTHNSNTPAYWVAGTGSIIESNKFLTAYHVVQSLIDDKDPYQNQALVRKHVRLIFNYKQKVTGAVENKLYYYDIKSIIAENVIVIGLYLRQLKGSHITKESVILLLQTPKQVKECMY